MWLSSLPRPCLVLIVAPLVLALAACGAGTGQHGLMPTATPTGTPTGTPTATLSPTATPVAHGPVVEVATTQHFADSKSGGTAEPCANGDPLISGDCGVTVTATCPQGAPVLSGGYTLDGGFVSSSSPSASDAWTITAHAEGQDGGSHPVTVTAYAECLHATSTASTQDVSSTP